MTHATPGHVGDVQQAVDAAQVDERTVVGNVLDHALHDRAFLQRLEQLGALFALGQFDDRATRQHNVVALAIELDDPEVEGFAFKRSRILDRTGVDQRTRQECADAVGHDGQAALDLAVMVPSTSSALSSAFSRFTQAARRLARSRDRRVSP